MARRDIKRYKRRHRYSQDEDLNPMNFVSNLSDVMLILAVGIMMALILHWNVQITEEEDTTQQDNQEAVEFSDDDLEDMEELPDEMEKMGDVYYDPVTNKYYIVENAD